MSTPQYPYGRVFQDKTIALMLREPTFLKCYADVILPKYFDSDPHEKLSLLLIDYYRERDEIPTQDTCRFLITDFTAGHADPNLRIGMSELLEFAYTQVDISDSRDVIERIETFGNTRHLEQLTRDMQNQLMSGGTPDDVWKMIDHTRSICSGGPDLGIYIGDELLDAPSKLKEDGLYAENMKIASLIPSLDESFGGGLGRKEVGIIMGYTGRGKSMILVNLGAAAVYQGVPIVHLSIGELEQVDILARYACRLSGMELSRLISDDPKEYQSRIQAVLSTYGMRCYAKYFPPYTKIGVLRSYLSRLRGEKDFEAALLIIDNADDLSSASKYSSESSYEHLGQVFVELKSLAHDFNVAVWTDSQTNRHGAQAKAGLESIADSHKKARKADVVIAVNQTDDEWANNQIRLSVVKTRRYSRKKGDITCSVDYARMLIKETVTV